MANKSIIQGTILVVLVAVAGGAYFAQQEGGLETLMSFLPGAGEKPAPAPPPASKPATPPPSAIPATPAKGQLGGDAFEPDSVVIEGAELALVQSKDPQSAVRIRLVGLDPWETPVGKRIKHSPAGAGAPVVIVNRMEGGEMKQQVFTEKYNLTVEFGKENENRLAGRMLFEVPGEPKTSVAGTFNADIRGFRIVDGKPALAVDSIDTLQYLALRELLAKESDKPVAVVAVRDQRFTTEVEQKDRSGYLEVEYRIGDQTASEFRRFQFVKEQEWKIARTLTASEIDEAHPLPQAPALTGAAEQVLPYLAARRLEESVKKKSPGKGIFGANFVIRVHAKSRKGAVDVSYRTEPAGETIKAEYLFASSKKGWAFERELAKNQHFNQGTGKIEARK